MGWIAHPPHVARHVQLHSQQPGAPVLSQLYHVGNVRHDFAIIGQQSHFHRRALLQSTVTNHPTAVRIHGHGFASFIKWKTWINTRNLDRDLPPNPSRAPHYGVLGQSSSFHRKGHSVFGGGTITSSGQSTFSA